MANYFADRKLHGDGQFQYIKQIKDDTGTMLPSAGADPGWRQQLYPTNPAGPTMFGYSGAKNPELVKESSASSARPRACRRFRTIPRPTPTWT
jgi:raffinose/stachyose/melibiose transport system substrate-binding protein